MRKRYILLKDTPELKKGAIVEEACDDGTQHFVVISGEHFDPGERIRDYWYPRSVVLDQPKWFEEIIIFNIRKSQVDKVKGFLDTLVSKRINLKKKK